MRQITLKTRYLLLLSQGKTSSGFSLQKKNKIPTPKQVFEITPLYI